MYQLKLSVEIMDLGKTRCHRRAEEGDFNPPLKLILGMPALPSFTPSRNRISSLAKLCIHLFFIS